MKNKGIVTLSIIAIVLIIITIIISVWASKREEFIKPEFDINAKSLTNIEIDEKLQYAEISVEEGYVVGICNNLVLDKEENILIYFRSLNDNNVYLKLRIYDKKGNMLKETGLIKQGEQIEKIKMDNLKEETDVIIKIMSYDPETYYSRGTVALNAKIKIGDM